MSKNTKRFWCIAIGLVSLSIGFYIVSIISIVCFFLVKDDEKNKPKED